jgi:hypothetical protein
LKVYHLATLVGANDFLVSLCRVLGQKWSDLQVCEALQTRVTRLGETIRWMRTLSSVLKMIEVHSPHYRATSLPR